MIKQSLPAGRESPRAFLTVNARGDSSKMTCSFFKMNFYQNEVIVELEVYNQLVSWLGFFCFLILLRFWLFACPWADVLVPELEDTGDGEA